MAYSSSLTDKEWELLEPLLSEVLPPKKTNQTSGLDQTRTSRWSLISTKNGCNWQDLPKDLPPYSTVYWHYKQWRAAGSIEKLMTLLHEATREQVKKRKKMDHFNDR
jgi:transposase